VLTSSHHGVQYQNMYALKASTVLFDKCWRSVIMEYSIRTWKHSKL
jgi:hypothetical protein